MDNPSKLLYFSATQKENAEETVLFKSIEKFDDTIDIIFAVNNSKPLSVVYNSMIDYAVKGGYEGLVLLHDDVELEHNPYFKLKELFKIYDLVGVAGCSEVTFDSPALWHIMGGKKLHGCVAHSHSGKKLTTSFGPYPHRVVMIDGVFMALGKELLNSNLRFDEDNPARFHYYDLSYSFNCHNNGFKVGVGDIYINHMSPGLREVTPEWKNGEKWFLDTYGEW